MSTYTGSGRLPDLLRVVGLCLLGFGAFALLAPTVSNALDFYPIPQHNYPWGAIILYFVLPGILGYGLARWFDYPACRPTPRTRPGSRPQRRAR